MLSTSVEHTRRSLLAAAAVMEASNAFSAVARAASEDPQIEAIRPFSVDVPEAALVDHRRRIAMTRWPERETVVDQSQGVQLETLQGGRSRLAADRVETQCISAVHN
jgi:hypothetical protein